MVSLLRCQRGATYIEVLVGLAIVSIVAPSLLVMMVAAAWANHSAGQVVTAVLLAEERIESLRSLPFEDILDMADVVEDEVPGYPGFERRTTVSLAGGPFLAAVEVEVWWYDRHSRHVALTTLIRRRDR